MQRLNFVLKATGIGLWFNPLPLGQLNWDERTRELFFLPPHQEPTIDWFWSVVHPEDRESTRSAVEAALRDGSLYAIEHRVVHPESGEVRWVHSMGQATFGPDGVAIRFDGINYDITSRKLMEEKLRQSELIYRAIGESIDFGVWICDPEGKNIYASPSFLELVGIKQEQCAEFGWGNVLHPDDADRTIAAWQQCVKERGKWDIEHRFRGVDGGWHPILARGVPVEDGRGKLICWAGINLDISRQKKSEEALRHAHAELDQKVQQRTAELTEVNARLQESLLEKEMLLREIHHRVKNNLQVVSSLLDLQSSHTQDAQAMEMFRESQQRVRSMALVHEQLYQRGDLANIHFNEYLESLIDHLFVSYRVASDRIQLSMENHEDVQLSIDVAVPCGLLLNELVSNCLKHAFVGRETGQIRIALQLLDGDRLQLQIADDGVGLPRHVDMEHPETFGLHLVTLLVAQLQGSLEVEREHGTLFRIAFPLTRRKLRSRTES